MIVFEILHAAQEETAKQEQIVSVMRLPPRTCMLMAEAAACSAEAFTELIFCSGLWEVDWIGRQ